MVIKRSKVACAIKKGQPAACEGEEAAVRGWRYEPYRDGAAQWRIMAEVVAARYCMSRRGLSLSPGWRGVGFSLPDVLTGLRWRAHWELGPNGWYINGIEWGRPSYFPNGRPLFEPVVYHEIPHADPSMVAGYTEAKLDFAA